MPAVDAAHTSRRALGNAALAREDARAVWIWRWLDDLWRDFAYAIRSLRRTPVFSAVLILTLALGIGANTAIFSIVNSLLLRALPVAEPHRLVIVSAPSADSRGNTPAWTNAIWEQIRQRAATMFDGAVAWGFLSPNERLSLSQGGGESQPIDALFVSGEFFPELGVPALIGRTFTSSDDVRGAGPDGPVTIISYALWQRRYGGDASVLGTPLVVERIPFTIVGVTPPEFFGPEVGRTFDIALPINAEPLIRGKDSGIDGTYYWLSVMVRLKSGQSLSEATALLRGVQPQIREAAMPAALLPQFRDRFLPEPFSLVSAASGTSQLRQRYQQPLLAILVVVALVLIIACANIANLLLARTSARQHELSVRIALGASGARIARQMLVESLVLAGAGAAVGLALSLWAGRALVAQLSTAATRVSLDLSLDWRILAFTAAVTVATVLIFGTAAAFRATRVAPIDVLNRRGASGGARSSLSNSLVVVQVALSVVLVVTAGLFVRTFERLATLPLGFDAGRVLQVNVDVRRAAIEPASRVPLYHQLVATVATLPGVAHAAGSMATPLGGGGIIGEIQLPGATPSQPEPGPVAFWNSHSTFVNEITPGWLATYGTGVRGGRDINERDGETAQPVALVNEAYARKFLSGRNPLGETVQFVQAMGGRPRTIVGIASDAVYLSGRDGVRPTVYIPLAQHDFRGPMQTNLSMAVRSSAGSPVALAPSIAAALMHVDRNLLFSFRTLQDRVDASIIQERLIAILSGFCGVLALLLAGIGLFGVTSYAATRRRAEIGIRMALGAQVSDVLTLVLRQTLMLVALGIGLGVAGAAAVTRYLNALLFGITPLDPPTFVAVSLLLVTVGTLAAYLPARRATRVDPMVALRCE
ncbi:MAG TPA: ABC transporter permease [Vicinamibacterales bacterium]